MAIQSKNIPAPDRVKIKRALISVFDKTGLVELAQKLVSHGVEIISTGGSAKALADAGIEIVEVSSLSGFPEIMDGRVKTLHPAIHGGLLAIRDDQQHVDQMNEHGIGSIDLLVSNLYPFSETLSSSSRVPCSKFLS